MTKEEHIKYWLESAEHDLDTADTLIETGKYDWALFLGHLVLEKTLKANYVQNNENKIPPKLHNLIRLAEVSLVQLDEEKKIILDKINDFNIEVRYPESLLSGKKNMIMHQSTDNIGHNKFYIYYRFETKFKKLLSFSTKYQSFSIKF